MRVLLVEDDPSDRALTAMILRRGGIDVIEAADFSQVDLLLDRLGEFDVVVMDVQMPAGTPHGVAMANMMRQRRRDLPVIFLTSLDLPAAELDSRSTTLRKPVDPGLLLLTVRAAARLPG